MYITGIDVLILIAKDHTVGHFYDYGGSIVTDGNLFLRFTKIFESIWSDGLGGYWQGRSLNTTIISFQMISLRKTHRFLFDMNIWPYKLKFQ